MAISFIVMMWLFSGNGNCGIILDTGLPARFVRGSFLDFNQPEFLLGSGSTDDGQRSVFPPESLPILMESITQHLSKFIKDMTNTLKAEVENTSAESAIRTCQFAASKVTAQRIINNFQSQISKFANSNVAFVGGANADWVALAHEMAEHSLQFGKMLEYLKKHQALSHGSNYITHFRNAFKSFHSLQMIVETMTL